jgi:hypothetical protein
MLRSLIATVAVVLFLVPAVSQAQFKQGDWDLTLSGNGANDKDFETFNAAASAGIGYLLSDQFEAGIRPTVNISDGGSEYLWNLAAFADFHFDLGKVQPFIGANLGYQFGGGDVDDGWSAGPEGGVKWFLNSTTYIFGTVAYQFNLNEGIDSGAFVYGLGIGVRL